MSKRPRMGRNLGALLGSAAKERAGSASSNRSSARARPAESDTGAKVTIAKSAANEPKEALKPDNAEVTTSKTDQEEVNIPVESSAKSAQPDEIQVTSGTGPGEPDAANGPTSAKPAAAMASPASASSNANESTNSGDQLVMVAVDQIRRGTYQPRRLFDQALLEELAESIKAQGLIQPIIVRRSAGAYELVAGERRWRAAQLAGMSELPAIVRDMKDQSVAAVAVIENIQRKDLNPLEEAAAFERLCDEFGMTHKSVAEAVGRSRASVSNLMRLLELHDEVKVFVDKGELEMGHARAILGAPADKQYGLASLVISEGMTVRAVEKMVREMNAPEAPRKPNTKESVADPDIERLSQKLGETLGAAVHIQHRANGAGKLEINYSSVSELQGILAHIK